MNNRDKRPVNDKGQPHGCDEIYYDNGSLFCRVNYINGKLDGCYERYYHDGKLWYICNYVNDIRTGYSEYYSISDEIQTKTYNII